MSSILCRIGLVLTFMCLGGAVAYPADTPASVEKREKLEKLEQSIRKILEENDTPGLIGAIVYGDEVVWQAALGTADRESKRPVTNETLFRLGSVSKSFVSLAALKLVEAGRLKLTDPIDRLAPEAGVVNPWADTHPVRLVHTLEHTAGFDDIHLRDFAFNDPAATTRGGIEFNTTSRHVRWPPGTRMAYSNMGPAVAALAIENVTGERFEDFVKREVFDALGMATATYFHDEAVASCYRGDGSLVPYTHIPVRASGAVNATSADMIQLLRMFNNRGAVNGVPVLQPQSIARMETPTTSLAAEHGLRFGYGLGNFATQKKGFVFQGHAGAIDGFLSIYAYLPSEGRGYFVSINAGNGAAIRAIEDEIVGFITQDLKPPASPAITQAAGDELRQFSGVYQPDATRAELTAGVERLIGLITVGESSDGLTIGHLLGAGDTFQPVGGNQFIKTGDAIPSIIFVKAQDDELLMQGELGAMRRVSPWLAYGRLVAVLASIIIALTTLLFAPIWLLRKSLGRMRDVRHLSVRVFPLLGGVTLLGLIALVVTVGDPLDLATPNLRTISFWLGSLLFAALAGLSLFTVARKFSVRREIGWLVWHHSLLASVALGVLTIFLCTSGLIGLRTWAY